MGEFLVIFVVVLLVVVAAVGGAMLLGVPGVVELPQSKAWPYSQRRFGLRGHRALRE